MIEKNSIHSIKIHLSFINRSLVPEKPRSSSNCSSIQSELPTTESPKSRKLPFPDEPISATSSSEQLPNSKLIRKLLCISISHSVFTAHLAISENSRLK